MSRIKIVGLLTMAVLLVASVGTASAKVKNGNFEKGNFSGWSTKTSDSGNRWELYTNKTRSPLPGGVMRGGAPPVVFPKTLGKYSPFINMGGRGTNVLYRTIKVPKKAKKLTLKAFWNNTARAWVFNGSFQPVTDGNQFFSIDLLEAGAKPTSTKNKDVLANLFAPKATDTPPVLPRRSYGRGAPARGLAGTPYVDGWNGYSAKLKKYRGEKVLLRLAETDTLSFNYVGIDDVKIVKKKK